MTEQKKKTLTLRRMSMIAIMAAAIAVVAPFSIPLPFTGVPITFTNLMLFLTVLILGMRDGTISYLIYLLLGIVGLPIFSGFTGGFQKIAGPTGGYLIGFIFLTLIVGFFVDRWPQSRVKFSIGMVAGMIVAYAFGTAWLAYQAHLSFGAAMFAGVIPFIPGDAIKIIFILVIGPEIRKGLTKAGVLNTIKAS